MTVIGVNKNNLTMRRSKNLGRVKCKGTNQLLLKKSRAIIDSTNMPPNEITKQKTPKSRKFCKNQIWIQQECPLLRRKIL